MNFINENYNFDNSKFNILVKHYDSYFLKKRAKQIDFSRENSLMKYNFGYGNSAQNQNQVINSKKDKVFSMIGVRKSPMNYDFDMGKNKPGTISDIASMRIQRMTPREHPSTIFNSYLNNPIRANTDEKKIKNNLTREISLSFSSKLFNNFHKERKIENVINISIEAVDDLESLVKTILDFKKTNSNDSNVKQNFYSKSNVKLFTDENAKTISKISEINCQSPTKYLKTRQNLITEKKDKALLNLFKEFKQQYEFSVFDFSFSGIEKKENEISTQNNNFNFNQNLSNYLKSGSNNKHKKRKIFSHKKFLENNVKRNLLFNEEVCLDDSIQITETIEKKNYSNTLFSEGDKYDDFNFTSSNYENSSFNKKKVSFSEENQVHSFNKKKITFDLNKIKKSNKKSKVKSILKPSRDQSTNSDRSIALEKLNLLIKECEVEKKIDNKVFKISDKIGSKHCLRNKFLENKENNKNYFNYCNK